ncbi:uncharacterized protein [Musca autumnalis]|uniref:uncharacterized protein n=1 Tax=Musca autumnalis TaxID=221902 RepID=UPI003CF70BF0
MDQTLQNILTQQQSLMEKLVELAKANAESSSLTDNASTSANSGGVMEMLSKCIKDFVYDPESNLTFEAWYARYDHLFGEDANKLPDPQKVRLVLRKLDPQIFDKYTDYLLPKVPRDLDFQTTVSTLKMLFGRKESLFSARVACLQFTKSPDMDFVSYGAVVNRNCDHFEFGKLTENQFRRY